MEPYYFTDTIFLLNDKLYHDGDAPCFEIKNHNWHKYLYEYGWEKINKKWIKQLNSYLEKPLNNSLFGLLDCGGDGNCLFHCISYSLLSKDFFNISKLHDHQTLRNDLSNYISFEKYNEIISIYRILKDSDDFDEDWDPYKINYNEFKQKIIEGGNEFWGDNLLINLIKEFLNINIIILNNNEFTNEYYHYPLLYDYDKKLDSIILLYENQIHFQLIGYFNEGKMISYFNHNTIPKEILKLINYIR
tara:strand:- start:328 stop:1065 length:738 start_codon:yes stop_codon:yes gene_type:complete